MVNRPYFIDIYRGDDVVDVPGPLGGLDAVKAQGIAFLAHKASEGLSERDSRYTARRRKWMDNAAITVTDVDGTILTLRPRFMAYHFLHGSDPKAEAANFLAAAELSPGDAACCDWERVGASGYAASSNDADAFCQECEGKLGIPMVVYGGDVPREKLSVNDVRWVHRHLWGCSYNSHFVMPPAKFSTSDVGVPWAWQDDGDKYGPGPHTIPGIRGYCDNSTVVAPMTVARLAKFWGVAL